MKKTILILISNTCLIFSMMFLNGIKYCGALHLMININTISTNTCLPAGRFCGSAALA
jgi:hypothetical protein